MFPLSPMVTGAFGTIIISKQNAETQKRRKFLYILSEKCKIKRQNDTIQYKGAVS